MALGDSVVGICNIALIALGETPIVSVDDPNKRAILCKARYDDVRRATLRSHPWNFARKLTTIPAADPDPPTSYQFSYPLPPDFMRMAGDFPDDPLARYDIVGNRLYINDGPPLNIFYIWDIQDATKFDPLFVQALGYSLAVELAQPLTQSIAKQRAAMAMLEDKMGAARTTGSQDNSVKDWDVDIWLRARQ
jgi:hypothetical protein